VTNLHTFVAKRLETAKMMIFSCELMRNLMMDLLDLAQMENNTFKLNKDYFSIESTIQKVFSVVEHVASKKNVALVFAPLDPREAVYYNAIYGDENRFIQVITNFLSNSLKFSNSGSQIVISLKMLENQTLSVDQHKMNNFIKKKPKKKSISNKDLSYSSLLQSPIRTLKSHLNDSLKFNQWQIKELESNDQENANCNNLDGNTCYIKFQLSI
jgi:hypothetical protein